MTVAQTFDVVHFLMGNIKAVMESAQLLVHRYLSGEVAAAVIGPGRTLVDTGCSHNSPNIE